MKQVLLASVLIFFSAQSSAETVDQLIHDYVPTAHVGLYILNADSKETLYSHNPEHGFTPASITKSFTTAAALLSLDPEFSYQTNLTYHQNQLQGKVLNGDLALVFMGDPSLTTTDLEKLLQNLGKNNIKTIRGNIIIDNTYFSKPYTGLGWVAEDLNWYFGTPAKTVIIDENQMLVKTTRDIEMVEPEEANTLCSLNVELNENNNIPRLFGCWPKDQQEKISTLKVALANPELQVKQIINQSLAQQGITLEGKINIGASQLPDILSNHQSARLDQLSAIIMKKSNNLYADSLAKILGKKQYQQSTLQAGSYAMTQILKNKLGLDTQTIRLYDGSGGSTYNQVTPQSVAMLLQAMYDQSPYKNAYLEMQAVDAQHTFYHRLPENIDTPMYLKTGSMTGVSNIAGYLKTKTGRTLIFVCLLNQLPLDKTKAREFEQALIKYLVSI